MKHQPYETWVFIEGELSASERIELQAHLDNCEACQALSYATFRMEREMSNIPSIKPNKGFTNRWRARLAKQQAERKQRNLSLIFGGLILATSVLFLPVLLQVVLLVLSPEDFLISTTNSAIDWLSWIGFTGDIAYAFARSSIETFPASWWGVTALVLMVLTVVWFVSLQRSTPSSQFERSSQR